MGCQIIDFPPISLLINTQKSSPGDPNPSSNPLKGNFLSFSPHLDVHPLPPPSHAAPSKPSFPGISPLPAAPGSCFGVPASSQPSLGAGRGWGRAEPCSSSSSSRSSSHPWESVKGENPHPLRSSLLQVFFFFFFPPRDSQAVQNIRKNNFHLSRGEPGSRRCSPSWIFQQGFASSQIRSEGMRDTIPNFFPQKCRRGLGVCWWRLDFPRDHRWEMGLECSCGVLGTPNPSSALRIGISSVPSAWGWIWEPKSKLRGLKTPKS